MAIARAIVERIAFTLFSMEAMGMMIGGFCLAGLGATLRASRTDVGAMPIIAAGSLAIGVALGIGGSAAFIASRARMDSLVRGPLSGGWLVLFLVTLVGLPFLLFVELDPLVQFWRDVWAKAVEWGVFKDDAGMAGYILVPIAGVLVIPFLEGLAGVTATLSCAMLLLFVRSTRMLRVLALGVVLTGTLLLAGSFGAATAERLSPSAERLIRETPDPEGVQQARALAIVQRYRTVTRASAATLGWAWVGLALWLPVLASSERRNVTSEISGKG